ncbi:penicillin-binding protein 2 [Meridianimarinicoccus aquatilis]|uniref:Penicillin-binding protein 2 n=1 Tax=Meridianimarinicoccus aquatilis TaxID=2552766 RepID=A0A4V3BC08_9RHOB|nr:penicillin-binding protein 2 [Fluviibacterium aquatile]TDL89119.1 penicillin-binding protein 2 [Fluviibacterium aquatile]
MRRPVKDNDDSARKISRRALVLGGAQLGFAGLLAWQMRKMQIEEADKFRLLAEENRINLRLLPPARGLIFDRNGVPIAENDQNYRVVIVREDAGDVAAVLDQLRKIIPLSDEDVARTLAETKRRVRFVPVTVADRLTWEDLSRVAVNAPALPGVRPEVGLSRSYPLGSDFAHVVGYVGPVSDYDLSKLDNPDPLLQIPEFQIGKSGVEARMEGVLRGRAGTSQIEVNAAGRVMRELSRDEGLSGRNIQLTIDEGLQNYVQARMFGESAACVVMEVETGDLKAVCSSPTFDPNLFVRGISVADYRMLTDNKYRPLANKSVQGVYPPGSTFKMVTALAALEAGVVGPEDTVWCPGYLSTAGRRFHCWKRGGHGHMNMHDSLVQSCDVYYYEVAQKVGIDKISAMARKLGIGVRHDIPMSAVAEGLAPTQSWKQTRRGEGWVIGDTINASIGQGFVLASPLQLAVMTARLAGGTDIAPRLVRAVDGVPQEIRVTGALDLNPAHLRAVRRAMTAVSNTRRGTGYRSRIVDDTMQMAGKSGTSQVRNITTAERARGVFRNEDLPWERRDHALFVSYAPTDRPQYAVSVVVEHGGGGSAAAAPVARDVLLRVMNGALPPLEAYPASQRDMIEEQQRELPLRDRAPKPPSSSRA